MANSVGILQFFCYNAPYGGNFISSMVRLEQALKAGDIETVYVFPTNNMDKKWVQELVNSGRRVFFLNGHILKDIFIIRSILENNNINIVHTHFAGTKYHALFNIVRLLYKKDLSIIQHLHNHDQRGPLPVEFLKRLLFPIDLYIGCGEAVASHFQEEFKIQPSKVTFASNAIEFNRLKPISDEITLKEKSGNNATRLLMFGFDYFRKGVDLALEAVNNLIKSNYNICLQIGLAANKEFAEEKIRHRFGDMPDWIELLNPREDIGSYYRMSDCFISPSRSEGLCYSLIEAAYCGIPIIASDIPGQSSLNIPHVFKFNSEDVLGLQQQIAKVVKLTPDKKEEIAFTEKEYVIKEYNLNTWANKIDAIYKGLIKK